MTHGLMLLIGAMLFPVACLFLVLWLGWLEDTLDVDAASHPTRKAPEPVRAIPVVQPPRAMAVARSLRPQASEVSR
jgi:hypothetical protein